MKLSQQQFADFAKLACERTEAQIQSVTQLMEDGPQVYALTVCVAVALIRGAADLLQKGMEKQNGRRPTDEWALQNTTKDLLTGLDIEFKVRQKKSDPPP